MPHDTERIYDELMSPLVTQLISLAREHDMALFVTVPMVLSDESRGWCTTKIATTRPEFLGANNRLALCYSILGGGPILDRAAELTVTQCHPEADAEASDG